MWAAIGYACHQFATSQPSHCSQLCPAATSSHVRTTPLSSSSARRPPYARQRGPLPFFPPAATLMDVCVAAAVGGDHTIKIMAKAKKPTTAAPVLKAQGSTKKRTPQSVCSMWRLVQISTSPRRFWQSALSKECDAVPCQVGGLRVEAQHVGATRAPGRLRRHTHGWYSLVFFVVNVLLTSSFDVFNCPFWCYLFIINYR